MKITLIIALLMLNQSISFAQPVTEPVDNTVQKTNASENIPKNTRPKLEKAPSLSLAEIRKKTEAATVCILGIPAKRTETTTRYITGNPDDEKTIGTGFFISADGYILTNFHILEECLAITILTEDQKTYRVNEIVSYSRKKDIALLKIEAEEDEFTFLEVIPSKNIKKGTPVFLTGHASDERWKFHKGHVFKKKKKKNPSVFSISTTIKPELSGAAIVNKQGQVFAMATCMPILKQEKGTKIPYWFKHSETRQMAIPSEFFRKIPKKTDPKKYSISKVIAFQSKVDLINYLAHALEKTHEQIKKLKQNFSEIKTKEQKKYNNNHRTAMGTAKVTAVNIDITNDKHFASVIDHVGQHKTFIQKHIDYVTGITNLDKAAKQYILAADKVIESAEAINFLDGKDISLKVEQRNKSLKAYNQAVSYMYKALIPMNKVLKKYNKHICTPLASFRNLAKLEKTYASGKIKANKSNFSI